MKDSKWGVLARVLTRDCVRNTFLEDLHSGVSPSSKTGDYSDVKVVSPYGEIPWNELSRISDEEMRKLMLEVENLIRQNLWTIFQQGAARFSDPDFIELLRLEVFDGYGISWDDPSHTKTQAEMDLRMQEKAKKTDIVMERLKNKPWFDKLVKSIENYYKEKRYERG
jgi:hypothetical protein